MEIKRIVMRCAVLVATMSSAGAAGQAADTGVVVAGPLGAELDGYLSRLEAFGFSGAVLVAKDGRVVLRKGYGWADLERRIPVTTETAFEVASVTKQFTASAVLKLEEMGKLSVRDSLGRFFADAPADKRGVTLHQLLSHSSGIRGPEEMNGAVVGDAPMRTWLERVFATPPAFAPGSGSEYSNTGFSVAAAVVETVSGMPYARFVREHLLAPAGLARTGFRGEPSRWAPGQVARGYGHGDTPGDDPLAHPARWGSVGAGGAVTTLGDLYRWEKALRDGRVLSAASLAKLFTAQARTGTFYDYGYAWRVNRTGWGTRFWWTSGNDRWGNAMWWRFPDEDAVVLFASNFAYDGFPFRDALVVPTLRGSLEPILLGREYTLPPWYLPALPRPASAYTGTYALPSGGTVGVEGEDGRLRLFPRTQDAAAVFLPALGDTLPARYDSMTTRVRTVVEALRRGGAEGVRALAAGLPAGEGWIDTSFVSASWTRATLARLEEQHGAPRGVEWMVTLPGPGSATTYARLRFARGSAAVRWYWSDGVLWAVQDGLPLSVLPPFRPQSERDFVSYHIPFRRALRARFELGPDGRAAALLLPAKDGEVRLARIAEGEKPN